MELPFAGLHALCAPMLGRLRRLPDPQRDALSTAFGLDAGPPPDRFMVGLAVLSLLADVAEEQPLLCIVDDAQWLDRVSAQTLAFVARRLLAERVGLVFARARGRRRSRRSAGCRSSRSRASARSTRARCWTPRFPGRSTSACVTGSWPRRRAIRSRCWSCRAGWPAVAGGFGLPGSMPLISRIEQGFVRQLEPLPGETRQLLLLAAAEPVGDVTLLRRAAELLGLEADEAGAGRGRGPDRHRRAGAVPASAGALGGVPGGERAGPPGRPPRAGRGDRSAARSRSARVASRARRGASRRGRGRRAGALGRPRAQPRRHRRGGRVPRRARRS